MNTLQVDTRSQSESISPGSPLARHHQRNTFEVTFERGRLRLTAVAPDIIRVRFTPHEFMPRRSWDVAVSDDALAPSPFELQETDDHMLLKSGLLTVMLNKRDGKLAFRHANGTTFAEDIAPPSWQEASLRTSRILAREDDDIPPGPARTEIHLQKALPPNEHYYGFGQRTGRLERTGRKFSHWNIDPAIGHGPHQDTLYQSLPAFMAVRDAFTWGLLLHSTFYSQLDIGAVDAGVIELVTHGGELDYYVFAGPTPAAVVEQLTRLTGRPFMPPLWAIGYHQSRWGYKTTQEMRALVQEFRKRDIPLDVLHFDIDYMHAYRDFTWDPDRFPNPKDLIHELREQGVRVVTIIDPGVKHDLGAGYKTADSGMEKGYFIKTDQDECYLGYCWPGEALFPDFTRPEVRDWWGEQHRESHVEVGVSGIWNDMNEPSVFDAPFTNPAVLAKQHPVPLGTPHGDERERTTHVEVHNIYGHLMSRATYEGLKRLRPNERPWVLTRSAFIGTQVYAVGWMGDNHSWWEHLAMSMPQLMSMGISGMPFVGVDIGGFFDHCEPELYARWIQLGTFYPFMRTHTHANTRRQEPWSFGPKVERIARDAIKFRYRLLPYLYTLAHHAHETGAPILRPLLYDFPQDARTYQLQDQAMVGPNLLIAPILNPGQEYRMVYLPEGTWYNYWSGELLTGGYHLVHAPLERIPVFVRGGTVLTLGNECASTSQPLTELTLDVYPSKQSTWTLHEDDGIAWDFEKGEISRTTIEVNEAPEGVTVKLGLRQGDFEPHPREIILKMHLRERPRAVQLNGSDVPWQWGEVYKTVILRWPDTGVECSVQVQNA